MDFTIVCNAPECARGHQLLGRQDQYHPCHYATRAIFSFVGQWIYLGDCHLLLLELLFLLLSSVPGVFEFDDSSFQMSICPKHRDDFGIGWRCQQKLCKVPLALAPHHVTKRRRKERTLSFAQSKMIYKLTSILVPVGSRKYSTLSDDGIFAWNCDI